ncbi:Coi1p NDAI_0A04430 [Naumovozyma dairenensis CBS 421]|uniref:Uncharacterized protein n=1 Tax=Naumovozyma dairenensis (strain ATCC 10597 / BCRC 20456 / CBS 421 / NBRC 0211 / NRRL Y-12639) TaxID=1071378 RepID=G0W461_NAUDC|nr:hypothetical protein NDAI_0A04430 [Naumovozyma dairenensis CBS 421]CCD22599.1 hypothetical protein NDAI_0A04430 [Naumovozyma dairenensis CBS 421]
MSVNPFKNIGKNILIISGISIASIYTVKSIVRKRREAKFTPKALALSRKTAEENTLSDYYDNLAQVKPGFPIPKPKDDSSSTNILPRKSVYEASSPSVITRKRGDKLGFLDRRKKE